MPGGLKTVHIEMGKRLYGGALQVLYLMQGLIERGHEAVLICAKGSAVQREAVKAGIPVYPLNILSDFDPMLAIGAYRIIRRLRPDVVHLHSRRGAEFFGGLAGRFARAPLIVLSRRIDNPIKLNAFGRLKFEVFPHKIIAISEGIKKVLLSCGIERSRIEMVHSGVVPSQFQNERDRSWFEAEFGIPEGAHVIGMMAQLIERKGHRYLFAAAPRILASHPDVRFLLLGTGPIRKKLDQLVRLLDLSDKVIFAGFRDDIERILPNLDMVVHPALREGLGVSLVQSACAGLPIVASAAGGIPEIVRDGETGLLVQPGDSLVLADAVIRLLNDPKRACQLGENARRLAEAEFSVDSMVEGNLRVYMDTLAQSFPR